MGGSAQRRLPGAWAGTGAPRRILYHLALYGRWESLAPGASGAKNRACFALSTGSRPDSWSLTPKMSDSVNVSYQMDLCKYLVCLLTQNIHEVTMVHVQLLQLRILNLLDRHRAGSTGRWRDTTTGMRPPSPYCT